MPQDEGLLFVFNGEAQRCMWMQDMHFSIDMIWLDKDKTITNVEHSVSPETYPSSFCGGPAAYVIEVNDGVAAEAHLRAGTKLSL